MTIMAYNSSLIQAKGLLFFHDVVNAAGEFVTLCLHV